MDMNAMSRNGTRSFPMGPPQFMAAAGAISDEIIDYIGLVMMAILNPVLGICSIVANILNITVFVKMGLSDGANQNFMILSASDCVIGCIVIINCVAYVLREYVSLPFRADMINQAIAWQSVFTMNFPQYTSLVVTVVISVVRCCCVAMPLKVKQVLTARRQLAAIIIFASIAVIMLAYVSSTNRLVYMRNPWTNETMAIFVGSDFFTYTLFTNIFFYSGFSIIVVCVIILTFSLRRAAQFREKSTRGSDAPSQSSASKPRDTKELQVIKCVFLVAIIFITCNIPTIIFAIVNQFIDGISPNGRYRNISVLILMLNVLTLSLNAGLNIFIYFTFNSRYKATFKETFVGATKK